MDQIHLALWSRVVFIDWNGVLCHDVFWTSIRNNERHPLHDALVQASDEFFREDLAAFETWMRGDIDINEVVTSFDIQSKDRRFSNITQYLIRRARQDCEQMRVDEGILETVQTVRGECFLVLATDNVDVFHDAWTRLRSRGLKADLEDFYLHHVAHSFDDVLCSSSIGVLKGEAPELFFGNWLSARGLGFGKAILLDDSQKNCEGFRRLGGSAIEVPHKPTDAMLLDMKSRLEEWLQQTE